MTEVKERIVDLGLERDLGEEESQELFEEKDREKFEKLLREFKINYKPIFPAIPLLYFPLYHW